MVKKDFIKRLCGERDYSLAYDFVAMDCAARREVMRGLPSCDSHLVSKSGVIFDDFILFFMPFGFCMKVSANVLHPEVYSMSIYEDGGWSVVDHKTAVNKPMRICAVGRSFDQMKSQDEVHMFCTYSDIVKDVIRKNAMRRFSR